jgi:FimV-like protein
MRQIIAFLLDFKVARLSFKPQIFGIFLSLSCSIVLADSVTTAVIDTSSELQAEQEEIDVRNNIPTHTVILGDTLWSVAKRLRPDNMPMAEAMDTLYLYNREAFLKGDSTKLIEGSVVSFPPIPVAEKTPQVINSKENQDRIIPKIEVIVGTNADIELSSDKSVEVDFQVPQEITQEFVDAAIDKNPVIIDQLVPLVDDSQEADNAIELASPSENVQIKKPQSSAEIDLAVDIQVEDKPIQSELVQSPSERSSSNIKLEAETVSTEKLKTLISEFDAKDLAQLLSKVKQLPIDFWVFVAALLLAMVINRSRKFDKANKVKEDLTDKADKPIETVLDGPFAGSTDDDVFTDMAEKPNADKSQSDDVVPKLEEEINLPGVEALEAQLREDADNEESHASTFLNVDFEDDTLDIDPLQIKLDMASLCIEMGDIESAQAILEEIIGEADKQGKAKAKKILDSIET